MERPRLKRLQEQANLTFRAAALSTIILTRPAPLELSSSPHPVAPPPDAKVLIPDEYKTDPIYEEPAEVVPEEETSEIEIPEEAIMEEDGNKESEIIEPQEDSIDGCILTNNVWIGAATYYSWAGCVSCSPRRIMANGQVLNDSRKTLAFMRTGLGTRVLVENTANNLQTVAVVTDRGGFERWGILADLTVATRNAIGGGSRTNVKITLCR
jgi:rare lipoprotein A (peptidoglycan hydrolase)